MIVVLGLLRFGIVFGPETNELVEMMRPENRPIAREIIEIVHDDSNEQIDDLIERRETFAAVRSIERILPRTSTECRRRESTVWQSNCRSSRPAWLANGYRNGRWHSVHRRT